MNPRVHPASELASLLLVVLLVLCLAGCSAQRSPEPELRRNRYLGAVRDAATAEPFEIYRRLDAVVPYAPSLIWRGEAGESEVLVVNWTQRDDFSARQGEEVELEQGRWVTLAPRLQEFCREYRPRGGASLDLRLEQLLGLPPAGGKHSFIEFWVAPADLWRPCPDPEITDHACSLVPPGPESAMRVSEAYRSWYEAYFAGSYGDDGYPWTRLGYTYDWGNPHSEVGLAEFVIRPGARVTVRSVQKTAQYCSG